MDGIRIFMIGIDLLGLFFSAIALFNGYKYKDMRYFNSVIDDMYSTLEWAILIFVGLLICICFV
jgi:hypothetical protein